MSTGSHLTVRGVDVAVDYKDIKHLHIGVYPPDGRVRVAAPLRLDDDRVRLAVIQRLPWIRRRRAELSAADRQPERQMVTGESHQVWGVRHRLRVIERPGPAHVELDGPGLLLYVADGTDAEARCRVLERWQREQLRRRILELVARWEEVVGRDVPRWTIRRMKTKWGSCNRETGHISFNLELATKHPECLEYVVVHEIVHLLERHHGARFAALMDRFLPDWRARRAHLDAAPLAHEDWGICGESLC